MLGKGFEVRIYDRYVSLGRLMGANKEFIEREIPHLGSILSDSIEELFAWAEVVVVAYKDDEICAALEKAGARHTIIDLVRAQRNGTSPASEYYGLCW